MGSLPRIQMMIQSVVIAIILNRWLDGGEQLEIGLGFQNDRVRVSELMIIDMVITSLPNEGDSMSHLF